MPTRTYNPWPPGWYGFDTTSEMCAAWGGESSQVSAGVHPAPDVHPDDHGEILTFLVLSPEQVRQLRTAVKGEISADLRALLDGVKEKPSTPPAATTPDPQPDPTVQQGTVVSYSQGRGVVELPNGNTLSLGSTYFHSGRPAREPKAGDKVEVVSVEVGTTTKVVYVRILGPASSDDGYPTEPGMWLVSAVLADLTDGYEPCEVVEHENLLCIHLGDGVYERASNYGWNGRA